MHSIDFVHSDPSITWLVPSSGRLDHAEAIALSLLCRILLRATSLRFTRRVLERLPNKRWGSQTLLDATAFRGSGACLSRSLARQKFYARRGVAVRLAIGANDHKAGAEAHAWLVGMDHDQDATMLVSFMAGDT